jgi:hypothetical protein
LNELERIHGKLADIPEGKLEEKLLKDALGGEEGKSTFLGPEGMDMAGDVEGYTVNEGSTIGARLDRLGEGIG